MASPLYHETHRPQFHFTPARNWTNDPNGLVYYAGEWHLFFQHNPYGIKWGNMTWGHAVSPDLVHWTQLPNALEPDALGTIYSGSAVVDWANTAGMQTGAEPPLIAIYTSAGSEAKPPVPFTQSIASSNDRGRTWTKHSGNPVLGHIVGANRDPKVIWHAPSAQWVMALYLDGNDYALFGSPNLRDWTRLCDVAMPGVAECPDFFPLPVDGAATRTLWVFWGAAGCYRLGAFDGQTFTPETDVLRAEWGANGYAAQTWSDVPESDGRRIQIAWMAGGKYPAMSFNQQFTFPVELTLRSTPQGVRLYRQPVHERELLRLRTQRWEHVTLQPGANLIPQTDCELFEVCAEIDPGEAQAVGLLVRGHDLCYDLSTGELSALGKRAAVALEGGRLRLQALIDRTSLEVFAQNGLVSMSSCFLPEAADWNLEFYARGGPARLVALEVHELASAWPAL
ncbi:MAG: glycoside hydrolase family 32 protein [Chloroflexi bacterium]|nr:glycoside hydrolase family 32 protein [Chloroflexota bacterium]